MSSTPVIKCESVYKIFGANAKKMLQEANGIVDAKTFQDAGCIVGVNNASFEVAKGEMLVVMGLSGSGKSTLLRCISRLTDATAGKIFIEGQDLLALKNKELIEREKRAKKIIKKAGAETIDIYRTNSGVKIRVKCKNKHILSTTTSQILKGIVCRKCN